METYKAYKVRMNADLEATIKARHPSDAQRIFLDILVDRLLKSKIVDVLIPTNTKATEISPEAIDESKI